MSQFVKVTTVAQTREEMPESNLNLEVLVRFRNRVQDMKDYTCVGFGHHALELRLCWDSGGVKKRKEGKERRRQEQK